MIDFYNFESSTRIFYLAKSILKLLIPYLPMIRACNGLDEHNNFKFTGIQAIS